MNFHVSNLSCHRGGLTILENVTFSVPAGTALVLRGPNGCGKTTLIRALAGIAPSLRGQISHDAESIAYAGHDDGLKHQLSVRENLDFWAEVFGAGSVEAALDRFDLGPLATRHAQHLSAGQKRRLGLARMMLTARPVWLLDEPTVSLDAKSADMFVDMIDAHLKDGGIALLATHVDLGLSGAAELDLTRFRAEEDKSADPFLQGAF